MTGHPHVVVIESDDTWARWRCAVLDCPAGNRHAGSRARAEAEALRHVEAAGPVDLAAWLLATVWATDGVIPAHVSETGTEETILWSAHAGHRDGGYTLPCPVCFPGTQSGLVLATLREALAKVGAQ